MARLIATIYHDGKLYGPSLGNADQVPPEVACHHLDPALWADGEVPEMHGDIAPIPADAEAVLDEPTAPVIPDGTPTYEEAFQTHREKTAVDVSAMTRDELRELCDMHGLHWVHRDTKADLTKRLYVAGFAL